MVKKFDVWLKIELSVDDLEEYQNGCDEEDELSEDDIDEDFACQYIQDMFGIYSELVVEDDGKKGFLKHMKAVIEQLGD